MDMEHNSRRLFGYLFGLGMVLLAACAENAGPVDAADQDEKSARKVAALTDAMNLENGGVFADVGSNLLTVVGRSVLLDGSRSKGLTGVALNYAWTLEQKPPASNAMLDNSDTSTPTFTPDVSGVYFATLVVSDGARKSAPAKLVIRASEVLAKANAKGLTQIGTDSQLSAAASTSYSGFPISFDWSVVEKPAGSNAVLVNPSYVAPTLVPDVSGNYKLRVSARTANGATSVKNVTVAAVAGLPPPAHVGIHFESKHCVFCHNGVTASGKTTTHLPTSDNCVSCHSTIAWKPVTVVDHAQVIGACELCHNGVSAPGKSASHILSSQVCAACHSVLAWVPAVLVDHTQINGACTSCHNGQLAQGKPVSHITTRQECGVCHTTQSWRLTPTVISHPKVVVACEKCHNGVLAMGKPAIHLPTTDACAACHTLQAFAPVATVNHEQVMGSCESCHNNVLARGKSPKHIRTTVACSSCHKVTKWLPARRTPAPTPLNT